MKKIINLIKTLFAKKQPTDVSHIFELCNDIAIRYGTKCSGASISLTYYPGNTINSGDVFMHYMNGRCVSVKFHKEPNLQLIQDTWELGLIESYGKP